METHPASARVHNWQAVSLHRMLLAYVVLLAAFTLFWPGQPQDRELAIEIGLLVAPAVAFVLCWQASRRASSKRERWSWRLLALSCPWWILAMVAGSFQHLALGVNVLSDVITVTGWQLYFLLTGAGLLLQVTYPEGKLARLRSALDAMLLTAGAVALGWQILLAPLFDDLMETRPATMDLVYSLFDLLAMSVLVSIAVCMPSRSVTRHYSYLVAASVVQLTVTALHTSLVLSGAHQLGSHIDPLWTSLAYVLLGLAALSTSPAGAGVNIARFLDGRRTMQWLHIARTYLPYMAMPAAGLLLYQEYSETPDMRTADAGLVIAFAMAVPGLVLFRQFITLVENRRLSRSLEALSEELEMRVDQRTAELSEKTAQLTSLNRVATQLSRCLTSAEVLSTGLGLALETTRLSSGVIWLLGPDGHAQLAAHHGLAEAIGRFYESLPRQVNALSEAMKGGRSMLLQPPELVACPALNGSYARPPASLLVAPLLSRRSVLGAMALINAGDSGVACSDSELRLAEGIGAELGVTLENVRRYEEAKDLADRDPVTGLLNHRAFHRRLVQELKRAERTDEQLSIIMMDIDGFKLFNDTYGHPVGDQVLQEAAALLSQATRGSDVLARYGGDEFVALLPDTGTDGAVATAERFRGALTKHPYFTPDTSAVPIKMSFGIATYPRHGRNDHDLIGFADTNMYESKQRGGDTITSSEASSLEDVAKIGKFGVLDGLITAVDSKDHYTRKHSEDVTTYALALAQQLGLSEESQRALRIAGLLHDVGKIGVPDRILRKPGHLCHEELAIVRQHALLGELIIKEVPNIGEVLAAVGSHHERLDGQGYPRGLKDGDIPLLGRILAVADAYSAMTSDRPYRQAMKPEEAQAELLRVAGTQLDPAIVGLFLRLQAQERTSVPDEVTEDSPKLRPAHQL